MEMLIFFTTFLYMATDQGELTFQLVIVLFILIDACAARISGRIGLIQKEKLISREKHAKVYGNIFRIIIQQEIKKYYIRSKQTEKQCLKQSSFVKKIQTNGELLEDIKPI